MTGRTSAHTSEQRNHENTKALATASVLLSLSLPLSTCLAQGTAFTYQGRLNDGTGSASGSYDLRSRFTTPSPAAAV